MTEAFRAGLYKSVNSFLVLCLFMGCIQQVQETASPLEKPMMRPATKPFTLQVTAPQKDHATTTTPSYEVKGNVSGGQVPYRINLEEHVIVLEQEGPFVFSVQLKPGENPIALTAKDGANATAALDFTINRSMPRAKLMLVVQKADYEDNDKIIFDLKGQEIRRLEALLKRGRTIVVAGKAGTGTKPEYLGEIVSIEKTGASRVKVQFRTPHPNIVISLYNEFILTEQ